MTVKECQERAEAPKPGDLWQFRSNKSGRNMRKFVGNVINLHSAGRAYVTWERANKGRYTGIYVDRLMEIGKRITTRADQDAHLLAQINANRIKRGKTPLENLSKHEY